MLLPTSNENCLIASRKGSDSISPTVPPTSTKAMSSPLDRFFIYFLISSVLCGITWTVLPR